MYLTNSEFEEVNSLRGEIEKLITNKSGSLSPAMIRAAEYYGGKYFPAFCTKCGGGRYNIITRLYSRYIADLTEMKNNKTKKGNINGNGEKKRGNDDRKEKNLEKGKAQRKTEKNKNTES